MLCFNPFANATIQGRYLKEGFCNITAGTGYVYVEGEPDAYEPVSEITVELELYKEKKPGFWEMVWSDSKTERNTDEAYYPRTKVNVDSGYNYMLSSTHYIKHGSYYESNETETMAYYVK